AHRGKGPPHAAHPLEAGRGEPLHDRVLERRRRKPGAPAPGGPSAAGERLRSLGPRPVPRQGEGGRTVGPRVLALGTADAFSSAGRGNTAWLVEDGAPP